MKITPYGPYDLVEQRKHTVYRFTDNIWKIVQFYDDQERLGPGPAVKHKSYDEKLPASISRAKRVILELALCNPWDYFVTLTISSDSDRTNLQGWLDSFLQWLRDQRKKGQDLAYVLIPEQHLDGSWHAHGLLKGVRDADVESFYSMRKRGVKVPSKLVKGGYLNWIPYGEKFGFVSLGRIKDPVACAFYCTKYVTKDNSRLVSDVGWHLYRSSRGLLRPDKMFDLYTRSPDIDRLLTGKYEFCSVGFALPRHDIDWADFVSLDEGPVDFCSMDPLDSYADAMSEAERYIEYEQIALDYWGRNKFGGYS